MIELPKNGIVTHQYLADNPSVIFVFGDNTFGIGMGGAAKFRHHPQSLGFITKRKPDYKDSSYFTPQDYPPVFEKELEKLITHLTNSPQKTFLLSKIGAGLANRFGIYESIIIPGILCLDKFTNLIKL
jgi:hypothetical protein